MNPNHTHEESTKHQPQPRWWIAVNDEAVGPYGEAYVYAALEGAQLPMATLLCPVGGEQWKPVAEWPQFARIQPKAASRHMPKVHPPRRHSERTATANVAPNSPLAGNGDKLPFMARAICIYAVALLPAEWAAMTVALCAGGSATAGLRVGSQVASYMAMSEVLNSFVQATLAVMLATGGFRLRRFRRSGATLLLAGLSASVAWNVVSSAVELVWLAVAALDGAPDSPPDSSAIATIRDLLLSIAYLASTIFEVAALIWLSVRRSSLPLHTA